MNTPYGLEIVDNCQSCTLKREECFCNLSPPILKAFSAISHQTTFPSDATLFVEGQNPRGVVSVVLRQAKTPDQLARWQGTYSEDGGTGRDAGPERGHFGDRV